MWIWLTAFLTSPGGMTPSVRNGRTMDPYFEESVSFICLGPGGALARWWEGWDVQEAAAKS